MTKAPSTNGSIVDDYNSLKQAQHQEVGMSAERWQQMTGAEVLRAELKVVSGGHLKISARLEQ